MAETKKLTLAAKLARIGKEIGKVDKSGRNNQQNYNYIEYGVVAGRIRELLDEYSVIIIPSVEEIMVDEITSGRGGTGYHYKLRMKFTLVNGDDMAEQLEAFWMGESADYGDKGVNKAETSGTKYFLMRLFNVSEKGEQEADSESPDIVTSRPSTTYSSKVDFRMVREHLATLGTVDELNDYWKMLHLTEKQANILKADFSKRKAEVEGE